MYARDEGFGGRDGGVISTTGAPDSLMLLKTTVRSMFLRKR